MVRRAAAHALAALADPASGPAILRHYQSQREEINVRMGLEAALDALGIPYERHPI
jgi:HEAT repeat protein